MHSISNLFYFGSALYMFRTVFPSETCRVLIQNKINLRYCASSWFYYRYILRCMVLKMSNQENNFILFWNVVCLQFCNPRSSKKWLQCIHSPFIYYFWEFLCGSYEFALYGLASLAVQWKEKQKSIAEKTNCLENVCMNCSWLKEECAVVVNMPLNEMSGKQSCTGLRC